MSEIMYEVSMPATTARPLGRSPNERTFARAAARARAGLRAELVGSGLAEGAGGHGAGLQQLKAGRRLARAGAVGAVSVRPGPDHCGRQGPRRHPAPLRRPAAGTERGGVGPLPGHGGRTVRAHRGAARPRDAAASGGGRRGGGCRTPAGHRRPGARVRLRRVGSLRTHGGALLPGGSAARPGPVRAAADARARGARAPRRAAGAQRGVRRLVAGTPRKTLRRRPRRAWSAAEAYAEGAILPPLPDAASAARRSRVLPPVAGHGDRACARSRCDGARVPGRARRPAEAHRMLAEALAPGHAVLPVEDELTTARTPCASAAGQPVATVEARLAAVSERGQDGLALAVRAWRYGGRGRAPHTRGGVDTEGRRHWHARVPLWTPRGTTTSGLASARRTTAGPWPAPTCSCATGATVAGGRTARNAAGGHRSGRRPLTPRRHWQWLLEPSSEDAARTTDRAMQARMVADDQKRTAPTGVFSVEVRAPGTPAHALPPVSD